MSSCIQLAHSLGMTSAAEGMETPEQLRAQLELPCELVQGYHFGRPAPPERLPLGSTLAVESSVQPA